MNATSSIQHDFLTVTTPTHEYDNDSCTSTTSLPTPPDSSRQTTFKHKRKPVPALQSVDHSPPPSTTDLHILPTIPMTRTPVRPPRIRPLMGIVDPETILLKHADETPGPVRSVIRGMSQQIKNLRERVQRQTSGSSTVPSSAGLDSAFGASLLTFTTPARSGEEQDSSPRMPGAYDSDESPLPSPLAVPAGLPSAVPISSAPVFGYFTPAWQGSGLLFDSCSEDDEDLPRVVPPSPPLGGMLAWELGSARCGLATPSTGRTLASILPEVDAEDDGSEAAEVLPKMKYSGDTPFVESISLPTPLTGRTLTMDLPDEGTTESEMPGEQNDTPANSSTADNIDVESESDSEHGSLLIVNTPRSHVTFEHAIGRLTPVTPLTGRSFAIELPSVDNINPFAPNAESYHAGELPAVDDNDSFPRNGDSSQPTWSTPHEQAAAATVRTNSLTKEDDEFLAPVPRGASSIASFGCISRPVTAAPTPEPTAPADNMAQFDPVSGAPAHARYNPLAAQPAGPAPTAICTLFSPAPYRPMFWNDLDLVIRHEMSSTPEPLEAPAGPEEEYDEECCYWHEGSTVDTQSEDETPLIETSRFSSFTSSEAGVEHVCRDILDIIDADDRRFEESMHTAEPLDITRASAPADVSVRHEGPAPIGSAYSISEAQSLNDNTVMHEGAINGGGTIKHTINSVSGPEQTRRMTFGVDLLGVHINDVEIDEPVMEIESEAPYTEARVEHVLSSPVSFTSQEPYVSYYEDLNVDFASPWPRQASLDNAARASEANVQMEPSQPAVILEHHWIKRRSTSLDVLLSMDISGNDDPVQNHQGIRTRESLSPSPLVFASFANEEYHPLVELNDVSRPPSPYQELIPQILIPGFNIASRPLRQLSVGEALPLSPAFVPQFVPSVGANKGRGMGERARRFLARMIRRLGNGWRQGQGRDVRV